METNSQGATNTLTNSNVSSTNIIPLFFKVFNLKDRYATVDEIERGGKPFKSDVIGEELKKKGHWQEHLSDEGTYKFFLDLETPKDIKTGKYTNFHPDVALICQMTENVLRECIEDPPAQFIKSQTYNETNKKIGTKKFSYHIIYPEIIGTIEQMKKIVKEVVKRLGANCGVDTQPYRRGFFRLPNQEKAGARLAEDKLVHIIESGDIIDFLLQDTRRCKYSFISVPEEENIRGKFNGVKRENQFTIEQVCQFLDCIDDERAFNRKTWLDIGFSIHNTFGDCEEAFNLWDEFSQRAVNYGQTHKVWASLGGDCANPITIGTLLDYAKTDDKEKYDTIMEEIRPKVERKRLLKITPKVEDSPRGPEDEYDHEKFIDLTHKCVSRMIAKYKQDDFIWNKKKLYSFNGEYWVPDADLMMKYMSEELYDFLRDILIKKYFEDKLFVPMRKSLTKIKSISFKKAVVETTIEETVLVNDELEFDGKWYLLGFKNKVLDLRTSTFRDYQRDDFISITTGYNWEEPSAEEVKEVNDLLTKIHPNEKKRKLLLEIFSTALEGRCLEKFIVENGGGRNGKGLLNDLLKIALGDYAIMACNALLFEKNKTGTNPEKNNLHKKRLILLREPDADGKISNSFIKEMTGGGEFSGRGHYETKTEKKLHGTTIMECNKRPLYKEEPQTADIERLIDIEFQCTFTSNPSQVDEENFIYLANEKYKNTEFQEKHKRALIRIVLDSYQGFRERGYKFDIPKEVQDRTKNYLEMSSQILPWIREHYEETKEEKDFVSLKDLFDEFKSSDDYHKLTKEQQRKYNKKYFIEEASTNPSLIRQYKDRYDFYVDGNRIHRRNVIVKMKKREFCEEEK